MESSRFLPTPEKQAEIFQYFIISFLAGPFHLASGNVSVNKFSVKPSSQYGYAAKCRVKSTNDENPMTHCDAVGGAGPVPRSLRIQQKRPATGVVSLPAVQPYFTALTFLAKRDFLRAAASEQLYLISSLLLSKWPGPLLWILQQQKLQPCVRCCGFQLSPGHWQRAVRHQS